MTCYVIFPFLTIVGEVKVSAVVFSRGDFKSSTKYEVFYGVGLSLNVGTVDISSSCSANLFLGMGYIGTSSASSKADYSLELSPDYGAVTDYEDVLASPRSIISISHGVSSMTSGTFHYITWIR